jgi:uncharacterized cupin superfamily protein
VTVSAISVKPISEIDFYKGPNAIPGIKFRTAGRALGVSAWGMNVLEIEPNVDAYPEHDHQGDGQEEVYLVLEGSATLRADGKTTVVEKGTFVHVPQAHKRHFTAGPRGLLLLALGATPGKAYSPRR